MALDYRDVLDKSRFSGPENAAAHGKRGRVLVAAPKLRLTKNEKRRQMGRRSRAQRKRLLKKRWIGGPAFAKRRDEIHRREDRKYPVTPKRRRAKHPRKHLTSSVKSASLRSGVRRRRGKTEGSSPTSSKRLTGVSHMAKERKGKRKPCKKAGRRAMCNAKVERRVGARSVAGRAAAGAEAPRRRRRRVRAPQVRQLRVGVDVGRALRQLRRRVVVDGAVRVDGSRRAACGCNRNLGKPGQLVAAPSARIASTRSVLTTTIASRSGFAFARIAATKHRNAVVGVGRGHRPEQRLRVGVIIAAIAVSDTSWRIRFRAESSSSAS